MSESTRRFSIAYPSENEQPFYSSFEQGMTAIDALLFAGFERGNVVGFGGGTIGWDGGATNELSFSSDIIFASPTFGQKLTWPSSESPIVIDPGEFLVFALTRGSTTAVTLTSGGGTPSVVTTSSVPISGQSQVIAYHDPVTNDLIFASGLVVSAGASIPGGMNPLNGIQVLVDSFGTPLVTGNATASGGTVDFTIVAGSTATVRAVLQHLRLVANGTCADATIQFFRDAARTVEVYSAFGVDPSTEFVDRTPATLRGDDGTALESGTVYGRITNNDAGDSTFDVEVELWG